MCAYLNRVRSLKDHIQEVGVVPPDLAVEVDCVQVCVRGVADSADVLSSMMKHSDTEEEEEECESWRWEGLERVL